MSVSGMFLKKVIFINPHKTLRLWSHTIRFLMAEFLLAMHGLMFPDLPTKLVL